MRTAAVLPVKSFVRAKQRLSASLADPLRRELAGAMVADVLLALAHTDALELTIVVTRERDVADAARAQGAIVIDDEDEDGQSAAASLAVGRALQEGFERVLCVPGDCPTLDPAELDALLGQPPPGGRIRSSVVIVPDRHGRGTNGLLLSPPDAIAPSFGPDSCERHRALALAAGAGCRVERVPSLLLDVDTGADLDTLRARISGHSARARHTRAVLAQPERTNTLSVTTTA
jgi:2-phospho-L-lactate/phosphoenolpyruvate guanylyltransferase